jgi:branched-subunit amino acid transport protein AzlD
MTAYYLGAILAMGLVTYLLRALPFLFFSRRDPPALVAYIARYLPPVIMTILVLNSFKGIELDRAPYGLPELVAAAAVAILQAWKRNALVSIIGGTALYMVLIRVM